MYSSAAQPDEEKKWKMKDRNREDPGCLLRGAVWEQQCYTIDISSTAMSQVSEG